jgi:hypothetical protein
LPANWPLEATPADCSAGIAARLNARFDAELTGEPYRPGLTPRPSGGIVFEIAEQVPHAIDPGQLPEVEAWVAGHLLALRGHFWEAHEVWEKVWAALPPNSAERIFVQAWIQLANACLKESMDRPRAAERLMAMAKSLFDEARMGDVSLTIPDIRS